MNDDNTISSSAKVLHLLPKKTLSALQVEESSSGKSNKGPSVPPSPQDLFPHLRLSPKLPPAPASFALFHGKAHLVTNASPFDSEPSSSESQSQSNNGHQQQPFATKKYKTLSLYIHVI